MLKHLLIATLLLLFAGIFAAWFVYRRTSSVLLSSAAFTFFFSFGFVMYRLGFPVPTLILIGMLAYEAMQPPEPCVPTGDGCFNGNDEATAIILVPALVQWGFWFLVFGLGRFLFFPKPIEIE